MFVCPLPMQFLQSQGSTVASVPWKNVHHYNWHCGAPWHRYPEKMYIITTGIVEHRGIGTLKKCTNKKVHHYNWHRGAPWHWYPEKIYKQKCTPLQLALGSTVASVPWKNVKTKMYIIQLTEGEGILAKKMLSASFFDAISVLLSASVEIFSVSCMRDLKKFPYLKAGYCKTFTEQHTPWPKSR